MSTDCCLCLGDTTGYSDRKVSEAWAKDKEFYICEPCQEIVDDAADTAAKITARIVARARRKILRRHAKGVFKQALQGFFERWKLFSWTPTGGWHLAGQARSQVYEALLKPAEEKVS